jgi:hypothetical protein
MNYRAGVVSRESGHSRLIGFLMPVEAEQWGVRGNFTEEGVRAINDVAALHNYAAMLPRDGTAVETCRIAAKRRH